MLYTFESFINLEFLRTFAPKRNRQKKIWKLVGDLFQNSILNHKEGGSKSHSNSFIGLETLRGSEGSFHSWTEADTNSSFFCLGFDFLTFLLTSCISRKNTHIFFHFHLSFIYPKSILCFLINAANKEKYHFDIKCLSFYLFLQFCQLFLRFRLWWKNM